MNLFARSNLVAVLTAGAALALASFAAAAAPPAALPAPAVTLASHKAVYSVTLSSVRPGGAYADVSGKMALVFTDACDYWNTQQKSELRTVSSDGAEEASQSYFSAVEYKDGERYSFSLREVQDGETNEFRGTARRGGKDGAGSVTYTKPTRRVVKLPPHFLFQTAQQIRLIEIAQKGEKFLSGKMFDGTEGGGASQFNAIVLKNLAAGSKHGLTSPLLQGPSHRVRVAFFAPPDIPKQAGEDSEAAADTGEEPDYEVTMTLHDNGVVSDYDYDYQDFSVHGRLVAIEMVAKPHC